MSLTKKQLSDEFGLITLPEIPPKPEWGLYRKYRKDYLAALHRQAIRDREWFKTHSHRHPEWAPRIREYSGVAFRETYGKSMRQFIYGQGVS